MKNVKQLCLTAMGIALFVALTLCIQVPVFENYYICLGYVVMTVYLYFFGIFSGTIVGTVGVFLYCMLTGGLRGMPGWIVGNLFIGVTLGLWFSKTKHFSNRKSTNTITVLVSIAVTAIAMLYLKSIVECVLYAQPLIVRAASNIYAFVADAVVIVASFPLCRLLEPKVRNIIT